MTHDWHTDGFPELRAGPPWVMQEMIAAQPPVIKALLDAPPAGVPEAGEMISAALAQDHPVVVCGCGTSEHAAQGISLLLSTAARPEQSPHVRARAAFSVVLDPEPGVCVVVSHEGETRATNLALRASRDAGARTIAITQRSDSNAARTADHVLVTPSHDDSWCHTLAYTSALATGAALGRHIGQLRADPVAAREVLARAAADTRAAEIADRLADRRAVLCAGAGPDQVTARELALKIAEGARLPTIGLELETVLHGQLAGHEPSDALILVTVTDDAERERIARRAAHVARAAAAIGLPVAGILSGAYDEALPSELTPAGRIVIELPDPRVLDASLAGLLAGAGALQTVTVELAHARQTNPDLIRREQAPYRRAAEEAESSADW
jgi:glutamine---fructose-6-phosphate transaminase (isomerizing)